MLRICDFNTFYSPAGGGVRQYLDRKIEFMADRNDVAYSMVVPGKSNRIETIGRARRYWIKGVPTPGAPSYPWIASVGAVRRALLEERPDVIEVGAPYLSPWLIRRAALGLNARLVGFWHSTYPRAYVHQALSVIGALPAAIGEWVAWRYAKVTYGRYDAVFAASEHVAKELARRQIEPVFRTPLGVDISLYHPDRRQGPAEQRVAYMGRLAGEKGIPTFLEAVPAIVSAKPRASIIIAGHGPLADAVQRLRERFPQIEYLGYVAEREQIANLVANAAVVVVPGGLETFSLSTVEALSSGTPVVCADEGAAAELVVRSGAGVLFSDRQADDLANAIVRVLDWPEERREDMGRRGRQYAVEHHAWDKVFEHQLECYQRVVDGLPPRNCDL